MQIIRVSGRKYIKMFGAVPPVGRCAKRLTSSKWLLLGYLELYHIMLVYIKIVVICFAGTKCMKCTLYKCLRKYLP